VRILVTGATGNVGRLVVDCLLGTGVTVRALTNNPAKAALPAGVEVAEGFIGALSTVPAALEGVDRLYLAPYPMTARAVADLAVQAGVRRIVDLSSSNADAEAEGAPSTWHYYAVEHAVERATDAAPQVEWTHLRPGEFMTNMLDWGPSIRAEGVVRAAYGDAAYAPIDLADIAAVAAHVLLADDRPGAHHRAKYELTGPESLSKRDRVRIIGEVIGKEIRFDELTHEQARAGFVAAGYEFVADWLLDGDKAALDHPQQPVRTVDDLLGRPPRTFAQWVAANADAFR
jgi:uncharacterized protein YbjT (DUF2867 family)